jgi:hypothetical protein
MKKAKVEGQLVSAGPDSAEEAECPSCGGRVKKRKRRRMDGQVTYFYRHVEGEGEDCQLRYRPQ